MDFNTRGRNQQFTYDGIKKFVEKQRNQKTVKKTNLDVKKSLQDESYSLHFLLVFEFCTS